VLVILARLILPVAVGILAVVMMFGLDYGANMSPLKRFLMPTAILYVAYLLPDLIIDRMAKTRIEAIRLAFPDTLDLMVICAEAGLTIDASLQRVSRELAGPFPEMADELSLTAIELNFMSDRRTAFQNFAARVPLDTANAVATTLIQTEKYGTPLASALRVLSVEFRHTRMMQAEAKAARLPVLMTIPMMVFLVPPIFVVLVAPAACSMMEHGL
jgi:tight adherence protein C